MSAPGSPYIPRTPTAEEASLILTSPLTAEEEMELDTLPLPMDGASTHSSMPLDDHPSNLPGESGDSSSGVDDSFLQLKNEVETLAKKLAKGKSKNMDAIREAFEVRSKDLANLAKLQKMFPSDNSHVEKPLSVSAPFPLRKITGCPREIPYFQWTGRIVFAPSETVYPDIDTCLNKFEDVMLCYDLDLDSNWYRLVVTRIDSDQRIWLRQLVHGAGKPISDITWDDFKTALIRKYGMTSADSKLQAHKELSKIRFNSKQETIEQFIDKFNTLRIKSGVRDSHVLVNYFLEALPLDLVDRINITLESVSADKKTSLEYICSKARNLYNQARINQDGNSGSKRTTVLATDTSSDNTSKRVRFSRPSGSSSQEKKPKSGLFCSFHRVTTHSTEDCHAKKRGEQPKPKSMCRRCGVPGWTPAHRCETATRSSPSRGNVTVRAVSVRGGGSRASGAWGDFAESSSRSSNVAAAAAFPGSPGQSNVTATVQGIDNMQIDSDEESLMIAAHAQNCKYDVQFSSVPKQKSNSILLPVIVENI